MNNPYTASFEDMRSLYISHNRRKTLERFENWRRTLTREQIEEQLTNGSGPIINEINAAVHSEAIRPENVEFICALQLADFYFPNEEKNISFELRRDVNPGTISTLEQLLGSFETNTHVDCLVRSNESEILFQIKRFRGTNTPQEFVEWLNKKVFKHYGRMNGTSLVVLLQIPENDVNHPLPLDELYGIFVRDALPNASFDTISLLYNDATNGHVVLHELFPYHHRTLIKIDSVLTRIREETN